MILLADIDKAVWQTIIYFDIFDYPLTASEVGSYLIAGQAYSHQAVTKALHRLTADKKLSSLEGFYFLPGRDGLVQQRKQRYLLADQKFKKALKNAKLLCRLPFVRAVFVTNSLAYSNAAAGSDIDLAIVVAKGRMWTARFFCAGMMKLLGRRPTAQDKKDKICLSFYLDENSLNIEEQSYANDIHLAFWLKQFCPVYDPDDVQQKLQTANAWAGAMLPNYQPYRTNDRRRLSKSVFWQPLLEAVFFSAWEPWFKRYQYHIMPLELRTQSHEPNSNVVISDTLLKLHTTDKRALFNERWQQRCKELIPTFDLKNLWKSLTKVLTS